MGCESMDTPGNPLVAAEPSGEVAGINEAATTAANEGGDGAQSKSTFSFEEPQIIPSEDLVPRVDDLEEADGLSEVELEPDPPGSVGDALPSHGLISPPTVTPTAPVVAVPTRWPIRLVQTVPVANPPRAILGLPDGSEVVVTPGQMLPEHRLVIMSIGPETIQVVKVRAEGDHAVIDPVTLQSMY